MYIYDDEGAFGYADGLIGGNDDQPSSTNIADVETHNAALGSVAAGDYLINVHAYHGIGGPTEYEIQINGDNLCPTDLP